MKLLPYLFATKDKIMNHGIKLFYGKCFYRFACRQLSVPYTDTLMADKEIITPLHQKNSYARTSHIVDAAIERLLDEKKFTMQKPLAVIDPYRFAPLTALLVFNTEKICRIRIHVCDNYGYQFESSPGTRHRIPVMYLRAGRKNKIRMEILENTKTIFTRTIVLRTCPLPEMIENMVTVTKHRKKSASPLTFVYGGDTKFPYAFDESGEIRFYLSERPKSYGLFPLADGRFLFLVRHICNPSFSNPHAVLAYEMDFLGRVYQEYYVPDGIHHDACEITPGGNILAISSSMEQYVEDAVIELDRKTGMVVKKLCLESILSEHPYFNYFDWAHINTISYLQKEHAILICARNLHSVIKIDWETDDLLWIFCDESFWKDTPYANKVLTAAEHTPFSYQAHAAYFLPDEENTAKRRLIIFDNHWNARRPISSFDGDKSSHARIYEIDEKAFTVRLLEDYKCPKAKIRSNAVVTNERLFAMCGFLNKKIKDNAGTIIEFDRQTGKPLNRYLTYNSFYRAWPLFADCHKLSHPMETTAEAIHVAGKDLTECPPPDTESALCLPTKFIKERQKAVRRGPDKFERIKAWRANPTNINIQQDLSELELLFYDEFLLLGCRDHLLEHVYLLGTNHCFDHDYTNTEQKSPALFELANYCLSIPTRDLPPDTYSIYVQCDGQLYTTKKYFSVDKTQKC